MDIFRESMEHIWALEGDRAAPDPTKIGAGWGIETVPRQWLNWIAYRQDTNLAYLFQKGIPEWFPDVEYVANKSYVQYDNIVYRSLIESKGARPDTSPDNWTKAFGTGDAPIGDYLAARDAAEAFAVDSLSAATISQARSITANTAATTASNDAATAAAAAATVQSLAQLAVYKTVIPAPSASLVLTEAYSVYRKTLTAPTTTVTVSANVPVGLTREYTVIINQGTAGGTVVWDSSIRWAGGTPPTLSTAANSEDVISILQVGGLTYSHGRVVGLNFA